MNINKLTMEDVAQEIGANNEMEVRLFPSKTHDLILAATKTISGITGVGYCRQDSHGEVTLFYVDATTETAPLTYFLQEDTNFFKVVGDVQEWTAFARAFNEKHGYLAAKL